MQSLQIIEREVPVAADRRLQKPVTAPQADCQLKTAQGSASGATIEGEQHLELLLVDPVDVGVPREQACGAHTMHLESVHMQHVKPVAPERCCRHSTQQTQEISSQFWLLLLQLAAAKIMFSTFCQDSGWSSAKSSSGCAVEVVGGADYH